MPGTVTAPTAAQRSRGSDARALLSRLPREGVSALSGELATVTILCDARHRRHTLRFASRQGETASAVAILSRYLPAAFEADISGGRLRPPEPSEVLCDLWKAAAAADAAPHPDLVEQTVRLAQAAPHRLSAELVEVAGRHPACGDATVTLQQLKLGRERHSQLRLQAGSDDFGSVRLTAGMGWSEEILLALAGNERAPQTWVATTTCLAEVASVQRAVARACDDGDLLVLGRLLSCPADIWDLDAIARRLLVRWGPDGLEQVLRQVEDAVTADIVTLRRLRHLLEGVADSPALPARFWAARPLPALTGETLEPQLSRVLSASDDPETAEVASQLAPHWAGRGEDLMAAAGHLLGGRAAPERPGTVRPWTSP